MCESGSGVSHGANLTACLLRSSAIHMPAHVPKLDRWNTAARPQHRPTLLGPSTFFVTVAVIFRRTQTSGLFIDHEQVIRTGATEVTPRRTARVRAGSGSRGHWTGPRDDC
jgi:hypothetical protein